MRVPEHTRRRRGPGRVAAAAALLSAVAVALLVWTVGMPATHVQAATYTVNAADDVDDGSCDGSHCSLREAINAANASVDNDVIAVGVGGPIVLTGPLPTITDDDLIITGSGQQVSQTGVSMEPATFPIDADRVQISNLVIDGESTGPIGIRISVTTDDVVLDGLTVREFTQDGFDNSGGGGGQRNTIRNSTFTANGSNGIDFNGGADNTVRDNVITNNGNNGLEVSNEAGFLIQGNTFAGNGNAQMWVGGMNAGQHMSIVRNAITSASDGIVINNSPAVDPTANIDIGLSVANRNVFRGTLTPADQHLRNLSAANINAIFNDWNNYDLVGIEAVVCHNVDAGCGPGIVDFDPFINAPMPLETPTPVATATDTPGPPTETPTVTATPEGGLPGDVETLGLIAGCNPMAWTGVDATPIGTIAGAVAPPDILVALWASQAGMWTGFSPEFPGVSDLTEMDRLDVVFVCVSAPGTFSRPVI